jgi:hypothetical protein
VDEFPNEAQLKSNDSIYIKSLGVQIVRLGGKQSDRQSKGEALQTINRQMGGAGMRTAPGVAAGMVANRMAQMVSSKDNPESLLIDQIRNTPPRLDDGLHRSKRGPIPALLSSTSRADSAMVVPRERGVSFVDQLTRSSDAQTQALASSYEKFLDIGGSAAHNTQLPGASEDTPFAISQNVAIVKNLMQRAGATRFDGNIPSTVTATLTDSLDSAAETMRRLNDASVTMSKLDPSAIPPDLTAKVSHLTESLYQKMQDIHHAARFIGDWTHVGSAETELQTAVKKLLPESVQADARVIASQHALTAINDVRQSLSTHSEPHAAILRGAYYETPELFPRHSQVDGVGDPSLQSHNLIVMEPHPNNAALDQIAPHDPVALIDNVFANKRSEPCTIVMDVTLNHLSDPEIQQALGKAKPYIDDGRLNLVLVQSGTKFMQNGMDLVGMGVTTVLNKGARWKDFNARMNDGAQPPAQDDMRYIANMLDANGPELASYLNKIRGNTSALRGMLETELNGQQNAAFELCASTDSNTVYIAIKPTDAALAKRLGKPVSALSQEDRTRGNQALYKERFLPAFKDLAATDRTSFGFNNTNFGECGPTVRITPGVEDRALLKQYAAKIGAIRADV